MQLIQLFVPLCDATGNPFPRQWLTDIKKELTDRFGGLTIYQRAPATGLWKENNGQTETDDIVVYEVVAGDVDLGFWKPFKKTLEKQFRQEQLMIRYSEINLIT